MKKGAQISLTLTPGSFEAGWSLCHLTSNAIANNVSARLAASGQEGQRMKPAEIESAVSFILNELVENALKFNQAGDIKITVRAGGGEVCCLVSNQIAPDSVPRLREQLCRIAHGDPGELLHQQVEKNVQSHSSGLGYLTILADYGASLSWRLQEVSPNTTCLEVMAQLSI